MRILTRLAVLLVLLVTGFACQADDEPEASPTGPEPIGQFQLVGRVTVVTPGATPPIDVEAEDNADADAQPDNFPDQPGSIRLTLQSSSNALRDECGIDRDDTVTVYWLTSTRFDPDRVLDNLQTALNNQRVSAQGDIYASTAQSSPAPTVTTSPGVVGTAGTSPGVAPASPSETGPEATGSTTSTQQCILVADHVEVSQGAGAGGGTTTDGSPGPSPDGDDDEGDGSPAPTTSFPPGIRESPYPTITPS